MPKSNFVKQIPVEITAIINAETPEETSAVNAEDNPQSVGSFKVPHSEVSTGSAVYDTQVEPEGDGASDTIVVDPDPIRKSCS